MAGDSNRVPWPLHNLQTTPSNPKVFLAWSNYEQDNKRRYLRSRQNLAATPVRTALGSHRHLAQHLHRVAAHGSEQEFPGLQAATLANYHEITKGTRKSILGCKQPLSLAPLEFPRGGSTFEPPMGPPFKSRSGPKGKHQDYPPSNQGRANLKRSSRETLEDLLGWTTSEQQLNKRAENMFSKIWIYLISFTCPKGGPQNSICFCFP